MPSHTADTSAFVYGVSDHEVRGLWPRTRNFFIDRQRISIKEKSYFFHLLAVMVGSGVPLLQSLQVLSRRTPNEHFRRVIATVAHRVGTGMSLSDSFAQFSDVFNEFEVGFIRSGESVGHLETVLTRLAQELDQTYDLQLKLVTASLYPILVLVVLVLVAAGMLIFLVPTLMNALTAGGLTADDLPFMTKILVITQRGLAAYWWVFLLFIAVIFAILNLYQQTEEGRFRIDLLKVKLPIFGDLVRKSMCLKFIRVLALLLDAGFPVLSTLKMAALSVPNEAYRLKIWEVMGRVQTGEKISDNLRRSPMLFSEELVQMIAIGEQTASLVSTSQKIATQYEREIGHTLRRISAMLEPLMIVLVGLFVGVVALAILMPIFTITGNL